MMLDFLRYIVESIQNLGSAIAGAFQTFVDGLKTMFSYIGSAFSFVWTAINMLPVYYQVFGGIIITILIVYLIVGREAGGEA